MLQYLKAGQITPLAKPTGGHRPLLMMSFLRRLALKSVMAVKKESVAKCAGPLQYGVRRPDGANTMIKTIQYLAEADNSRVLVALDLKAAFQNVTLCFDQLWHSFALITTRVLNSLLIWMIVPVGQTTVSLADHRCRHYSHQISQPCPAGYEDTSMERLLPGHHST